MNIRRKIHFDWKSVLFIWVPTQSPCYKSRQNIYNLIYTWYMQRWANSRGFQITVGREKHLCYVLWIFFYPAMISSIINRGKLGSVSCPKILLNSWNTSADCLVVLVSSFWFTLNSFRITKTHRVRDSVCYRHPGISNEYMKKDIFLLHMRLYILLQYCEDLYKRPCCCLRSMFAHNVIQCLILGVKWN